MLAVFTAGLVLLATSPGWSAEKLPSPDQLRKEVKQLRQAGKEKDEILKILTTKYKGLDLKGLAALGGKDKGGKSAAPEIVTKPLTFAAPARTAKPAREIARLIDTHIEKTLKDAKLTASPLCSDDEFVRRAYLDITGVIPTADQARTFFDSKEPNKRATLIDQLLASPNFGRHMADLWQAKLYPKDSTNRFLLKQPFVDWMAESFNKNMPWDQFVTNILAGSGTVGENPAVTFILANQAVDKLTDHVGNHFLNIQLQCAQCHNHPFIKDWKQEDYWGVAAFFSKVQADKPRNANKGGDNSLIGVVDSNTRSKSKDFFPEATKDVAPKYFKSGTAAIAPTEALRPVLTKWMTSPSNPFFAKAMVNRTWAQLFGPGFVNPIEDMHDDNPASHPELFLAMAEEFGHTGYDLKNLFRSICNSQTYQRTSKPNDLNKDDSDFFSHQTVKVMTPEQLYDSLNLLSAPEGKVNKGKAQDQPKKGANGPRDQFVNFFLAGAEEPSTTEFEMGIPQALKLMNSRAVTAGKVLQDVSKSADPAMVIEKIYLSTLSRRPTTSESKRLADYVAKNGTNPTTFGDILWAVLNSSEFTMVR